MRVDLGTFPLSLILLILHLATNNTVHLHTLPCKQHITKDREGGYRERIKGGGEGKGGEGTYESGRTEGREELEKWRGRKIGERREEKEVWKGDFFRGLKKRT